MDNPAIEYWPNGVKKSEEYLVDGIYHRIGGPAIQRWNDAGILTYESWQVDSRGHRLDGPSTQMWKKTGVLIEEEWMVNGVRHRLDGPAYRSWTNEGVKRYEEWTVNGKTHRLTGPAFLRWENGRLDHEAWFLNDVRYKREDHPFNVFRFDNDLSENYNTWSDEMKVWFMVTYG